MNALRPTAQPLRAFLRQSSSSASSRWKTRQSNDPFTRDAKTQGLRSRAAFKLLEMDKRHRLFRRGMTVVDLGFAPGSWSQVAAEKTAPHGITIGIDLLPATAPAGVVALQGDFLAPAVQQRLKTVVVQAKQERALRRRAAPVEDQQQRDDDYDDEGDDDAQGLGVAKNISPEKAAREDVAIQKEATVTRPVVDVVISDMMMNTSGMAFRDHAGSMDLCSAALSFAEDTLRPGGHFICKFYQGAEDKALETRLKGLFAKVFREKPDSSRKGYLQESKEAYFVAIRRKRPSQPKEKEQ